MYYRFLSGERVKSHFYRETTIKIFNLQIKDKDISFNNDQTRIFRIPL